MISFIITIQKGDVYTEVARLSSYTGDRMPEDATAYGRMFITEQDSELLEPYWDEACSAITSTLQPFFSSVEEGSEKYSVSMALPSNWDPLLKDGLKSSIRGYFIRMLTAKWYKITNRTDVEAVMSDAIALLADIHHKVYSRTRTTIVPAKKSSGGGGDIPQELVDFLRDLYEHGVSSDLINNGAVIGSKIANDAVVSSKIHDNAVTTNHIRNGNVTEGKIADGAVTTDKVAAEAITKAKLSQAIQDGLEVTIGGTSTTQNYAWGATSVNVEGDYYLLNDTPILNFGTGNTLTLTGFITSGGTQLPFYGQSFAIFDTTESHSKIADFVREGSGISAKFNYTYEGGTPSSFFIGIKYTSSPTEVIYTEGVKTKTTTPSATYSLKEYVLALEERVAALEQED